jgi:hypothetical protein
MYFGRNRLGGENLLSSGRKLSFRAGLQNQEDLGSPPVMAMLRADGA